MLLPIHLLQHALSDERMEEELIDVPAVRSFGREEPGRDDLQEGEPVS